MRQAALVILRDRALLVGLLGGALVAIAGWIGYLGIPLFTGEGQYLMDAAMGAGFDIPGYPLWYHGTVVVLPAFGSSLLGTLFIRRWGQTGNTPVLKLAISIVSVPIITILIAYVATAVTFGAMSVVGAMDGSNFSADAALNAVFGMIGMTGLALVFGLVAVTLAMMIVAPGLCIGVIGGYLLARGLIRLNKPLSE